MTDTVLFLGRLTDLKGVDYLLRALPLASERLGRSLSAIVAGSGPEEKALKVLAGRLGLNVEFTGWVAPSSINELFDRADIIALPSIWPEPFGLVGLEAAQRGVPAVAFASGGIPDWLAEGRTGELAPANPPTIAGFADALARALAPSHHQRLREQAWESAETFSESLHVARLESAFRELVPK